MNTGLINVTDEIRSDLLSIESNSSLYDEINFSGRADAIDFLDFHIMDRIDALHLSEELEILELRAEQVKNELEQIDTNLFEKLCWLIRTGACRGSAFTETVNKYMNYKVGDGDRPETRGYDNLDGFINGLLLIEAMPESVLEREEEMVFYQQTPARVIFELAEMAILRADEVFYDIGCGLGHVSILVNLITGAVAKGIEFEPAYCNYAGTSAKRLNLTNVEFINADARQADYTDGAVFFLYTPFTGQMLQDVLGLLQIEAQNRVIQIFTYGPCSRQVSRQNWLKSVNGEADDDYKLYEFRATI